MLIARGNNWKELEKQINETGYTGTTWEVHLYNDTDFPASFFTDLAEAREYAESIDADTMESLFGSDTDGQVLIVEEDEWEDGEFVELGFCTCYEYQWNSGKWEIVRY